MYAWRSLWNNAGVVTGATVQQTSEQDFDWLLEINFWGVVRMTRAFLPMLRSSDEARLINRSSLWRLITRSGANPAKFTVRDVSNAFVLELANSTVGVTLVHPGGVRIAIANSAQLSAGVADKDVRQVRDRISKLPKLPAEQAAEIIVSAVERRKRPATTAVSAC